jgi:hypothetical protein
MPDGSGEPAAILFPARGAERLTDRKSSGFRLTVACPAR